MLFWHGMEQERGASAPPVAHLAGQQGTAQHASSRRMWLQLLSRAGGSSGRLVTGSCHHCSHGCALRHVQPGGAGPLHRVF